MGQNGQADMGNISKNHVKSVEIDISGRVEDTSTDTVIVLANGVNKSLLISKKVKRNCLNKLRKCGFIGDTIYLRIYVIALFCLIKPVISKLGLVVLDEDFRGKEKGIKEQLINLFKKYNIKFKEVSFMFKFIGKQSPAHRLAISSLRKRIECDSLLTEEEIISEFNLKKRKRLGTAKSRNS